MNFKNQNNSKNITIGFYTVELSKLESDWTSFVEMNLNSYKKIHKFLPSTIIEDQEQFNILIAYSLGEYITFEYEFIYDDPMTRFMILKKLIEDSLEIQILSQSIRDKLYKKYILK